MKCYNGCPDSTLQRKLDRIRELKDQLRQVYPAAQCMYFPAEAEYQGWQGTTCLSGMHGSAEDALQEALRRR